jgi:hypothetical protein
MTKYFKELFQKKKYLKFAMTYISEMSEVKMCE